MARDFVDVVKQWAGVDAPVKLYALPKRRAQQGAALLDTVMPGWADEIDLTTLNLGSPERCILGQLADDGDDESDVSGFDRGQNHLFDYGHRWRLGAFGFDVYASSPYDEDLTPVERERQEGLRRRDLGNQAPVQEALDRFYATLTEAWHVEVATRQAASNATRQAAIATADAAEASEVMGGAPGARYI